MPGPLSHWASVDWAHVEVRRQACAQRWEDAQGWGRWRMGITVPQGPKAVMWPLRSGQEGTPTRQHSQDQVGPSCLARMGAVSQAAPLLGRPPFLPGVTGVSSL